MAISADGTTSLRCRARAPISDPECGVPRLLLENGFIHNSKRNLRNAVPFQNKGKPFPGFSGGRKDWE